MIIVENAQREVFRLPGLEHRTLAGIRDGLSGVQVWMQTIQSGAGTPVHYHDCEEVIVVLQGSGVATVGDESLAFGPNATLIIPTGEVHQVVNTGAEEISLIASFSSTPVGVFDPKGNIIPLPWST